MLWQRAFKNKWIIATIIVVCVIPVAIFIAAKLNPSTIKISPSPLPSQALLDDAALVRLGPPPDVKQDWRWDIAARQMPIRSLFSDDFSDLQFLKPLLKDKRLVMLGENSHGVAEYNWMKGRLIRFLHREMGFDVLAFEGSMTGSYFVDKELGSKTAVDSLRNAVFGTWWTEEVKDTFEYLRAARQQENPLTLAGFDIQNSSTHASSSAANLFKKVLASIESPLLARVDDVEKALSDAYLSPSPSAQEVNEVASFYQQVLDALTAHRSRLETVFVKEPSLVSLTLQEVQSRIKLAENQSVKTRDPTRSNDIRDAGMAANLNFLLDTMYPNRKVIVWAHNAHIGAGYPWHGAWQGVKGMGAWIAETRRAETYSIGLFMGKGGQVTNAWTKQVITFNALTEPNTLEAIMASTKRKMSFVDFSQARPMTGNEWMFTPIDAKDWGTVPIKFVPRDVFDAVLYIDDVTPPKYL
ncbi:MAG: erythromycin esterase family protein [Aeromicrobium sp.]|nr:erythromycin esterase family protein [Burkholderiales bacterium]